MVSCIAAVVLRTFILVGTPLPLYAYVLCGWSLSNKQIFQVQLLFRDNDIHIIAINETKLDSSYFTQLNSINGFKHEHKDRRSIGGGAAIDIKDCIRYKL